MIDVENKLTREDKATPIKRFSSVVKSITLGEEGCIVVMALPLNLIALFSLSISLSSHSM